MARNIDTQYLSPIVTKIQGLPSTNREPRYRHLLPAPWIVTTNNQINFMTGLVNSSRLAIYTFRSSDLSILFQRG